MKPVILAVASDDAMRSALGEVLRRRFGSDYTVVLAEQPYEASRKLGAHRDAGEQVALVIMPLHPTDGDDLLFLIDAHRLHAGARRVAVIDVGDVTVGDKLRQSLTLNHVDFYFGQPWASPEEEVYPVLGEALRLWAHEHQPRYEKVAVIDRPNGARGLELRGWLERNTVATTLLPVDDGRAQALLGKHRIDPDSLPVVVLYDGTVLVDPMEDALAEALGARTHPTLDRYDVAIVGAGPAGLAAAVYAGSEGLHAILIEHDALGGQAGSSAKIRNYLGFPWGVGGADLTERASHQAEQLGAEVVVARRAEALRAEDADRVVTLSNGDEVTAATVILAGGVTYRRLGVATVDALVGSGVFYGAAPSEAVAMRGLEVFVIGSGNSAGQAAAHLASNGAHVTILVRGESLTTSMSDYLIRELEASPAIAVRLGTEVVDAGTAGHLDHLVLRDHTDGSTTTVPADALFIFIGARPHTDWLADVLAVDDGGFLLTGHDLEEQRPASWPLERAPLWLETSMPAVFAAGDIRHGSIKRVAAAVGEGSTAAILAREQLAAR